MHEAPATTRRSATAPDASSPIDPAIRRLDAIAGRVRMALVSERALLLIAMLGGALLAAVLLDAAFRWPAAIRFAILIAIAALAITIVRRSILPAVRFRPTALDIALRLERRTPSLSGRLASAVDFRVAARRSGHPSAPPIESALREAAARIDATALALPIRSDRIRRAIAAFLVSAIAIGLPALLLPTESRIGLERTLMPWSDAQWPARTALRSLVDDGSVAARGRPFVLAAELEKGDPGRERVEATYRVERGGEKGPWERIVLTRQQDRRFERRIPSDADSIEFLFETEDFETPVSTVRFVTPPEVVDATIGIEPPPYAVEARPSRRFELGPGTDRRAVVPAAQLAGSRATLVLELSKPMPAPQGDAIAETIPGLPDNAVVRAEDATTPRWVAEWTLEAPTAIEPRLRDEHGLESSREPVFRIDVVADEPPSVAVLDPARDESVLPTAVITIAAEARDDVAVESGAILAARGDRPEEALAISIDERSPRRRFEATLSLESIGAGAGDLVEVAAIASDGFPDREATRSQPRRLRVVGDAEFARQIRDELSAIRRAAIRIDETQQAVVDEASVDAEDAASAQAQVSQRIAAVAEATRSIGERLARNRPSSDRDPELVADAAARLAEANEASRRAEEALREQAASDSGSREGAGQDPVAGDSGSQQEGGEPSEQDRDRSFEASAEEVRREVQALVALLEQDEDTWSLLRELENLAGEVGALEQASRELGEQTAGRGREELDATQRAELDALARRQAEAAEAAERLLEEIVERAERVEERDVAQAEALRQAAQEARQSRLEQEMREAAQELAENRTDAAQQSQQAAQQALERMQRTLEDTRKVRTETLRRLMTELAEAIEALLRRAEAESGELRAILPNGPPWADASLRDRANAAVMLERNTRSVETQAASGGEDAAEVARALDRAASAQSEAVIELRSAPPRAGDALASIDRSITLLREALDAARRIENDAEREAARQAREALAASYRELAGEQQRVAASARDLADRIDRGEVAARRRLAETRRASGEQEAIGEQATKLESQTEAIAEAAVFAQSHDWIDRWSGEATTLLRGGESGREVERRQVRIAETALAMAESLESLAEDDDPFSGESGGSQSGGGGSGGGPGGEQDGAIPPIAELRLLKSMQEQVYRTTRALSEEAPGEGARANARRDALSELVSMQRSIRELGEALLAKLERENAANRASGGGPNEADGAAGSLEEGSEGPVDRDRDPAEGAAGPVPIGAKRGFSSEPPAKPAAAGAAPPPASSADAESKTPPPSLDELLGLEEEDPEASEAAAADSSRRVAERLRERPIADDFREAIAQMRASEGLLEEAASESEGDAIGLGTQRVQEEIIRRLDALIQSAQRQRQRQQQQQQSSSSSSSSQSQPSPSEQSGASSASSESSRNAQGSESGDALPPAFEEAELGAMLEEGRVEWGNLPERVRELVRQGRRDRVSSIYRRLTEQYYRRLAEEARP